MTVREFLEKTDDRMMVKVVLLGEVVTVFDSKFANCIIDGILNLGIEKFSIENISRSKVFCTINAVAEDTVTVSSAEMLQSAMDDDVVTQIILGTDIESESRFGVEMASGEKTLVLNGHFLTGKNGDSEQSTAAIHVSGGTLTIVGDSASVVNGGEGGTSNIAVWAYSKEAKIVIMGGAFDTGLDKDGDTNSTIYAEDGATIEIHGGNFANSGAAVGLDKDGYVLNIQNGTGSYIICSGGYFLRQNPADGDDKDTETGATFLADGCDVETEEDPGFGIWYHVVEKE